MRVKLLTIAVAAVATLGGITACSAPDEASETTATSAMTKTVERTETTTAVPAPAQRPTDTSENTPPTSSQPALMPNVVCMNLQDAQNAIQAVGVFFSRSEDATGRNRSQLVDRNWIVVGQTPSPGTAFGEGDAVLSAVKIGESNDC
ncbi:PASTA domain-containing protein [Gordonia rubripertincta]|uniref:PASTA domain-containing protein n=1 Tax=Gordonia rubripertincta TaxID=36822 RepID=A0AAW4G8W5_GORRU|nr:PASTA domain-containing protein [Gordonia rubripertincta]MBM7280161.1 PASTA domain-containing protein [Gordonia rubripertincta]